MRVYLLFAVLCLALTASSAQDSYCDPALCPIGNQPHVACNSTLV